MLDGWYCRSIANKQAEDEAAAAAAAAAASTQRSVQRSEDYSSDSSRSEPEAIDYKAQYSAHKKKLKYLLYENEYYQDILRTSQRKLLKACRDRSFLLDRLLQYEKPENTSSDSDDSDSSYDGEPARSDASKRRKAEFPPGDRGGGGGETSTPKRPQTSGAKPRKRPPAQKRVAQNVPPSYQAMNSKASNLGSDGHMTPEEVERHLQSRQSFLELVPERAPPTVPTEMFSNDPSLDSESNDLLENSPYNMGEEWVE